MSAPRRVCLVSPGHVSSNPRLVKEANALAAAGYEVHAVVGRYFPPLLPHDEKIFSHAPWSPHVVDYARGPVAIASKVARRLLRSLACRALRTRSLAAAGLAHHAAVPQLARAARAVEAELYIGHCLAGLAAATLAARARGARVAFDAEDFHADESESAEDGPVENPLIERVERECLPSCRYITASSPGIAQAYRDRYGVAEPTIVLNVFPLAEAPPAPVVTPTDGPRRFYWFSQTIGPDRGLELILPVLAAMRTPTELHLRGFEAPGFRAQLQDIAGRAGFRGMLEFHPVAAASEMARLSSGYDIGLSLESSSPPNRDLCLTNKIFTYLLAGIPLAMTPTSAQRRLAAALGEAALLVDLKRPAECARMLDEWFMDAALRGRAREHAWSLARTRYNWDIEQRKLLDCVASAFLSR